LEAIEYGPLSGHVVCGSGSITRLADEVKALGCSRAVVLSDDHHAETAALGVRNLLGERASAYPPRLSCMM
jgi:hypothetical protein